MLKPILKRLSVIALLILAACGVVRADNPAVVTSVDPGGVSVNFGSQQQAQSGQEFYVYHNGVWVGRIRLNQVNDNSSTAQVIQTVSGAAVLVGDVISSYPPSPAAMAPAPALPPVYTGPSFPDLVNRMTRSFSFGGGMPGTPMGFNTGPNYLGYSMMAAPLFIGNGLGSMTPFYLGSTVMMGMQQNQMQKQMNASVRSAQSQISVIYWDSNLLEAYAASYVADNETDPAKQAQMRNDILAQKGVDKNYIFQIQITNRGFNPFQVGPFNQRFFLLDSNGNRLAARRYDSALDGSIPSGGQVSGYVYFDRYDINGNPRLTGPVRVVVDNLIGSSTKMSW